MVSCAAVGCKNNALRQIPGINFHRFPLNPIVRFQWILAVRRANFTPSRWSRLCSKHFVESDFKGWRKGARLLKRDAVPSVFDYMKDKSNKDSSRKRKLSSGSDIDYPSDALQTSNDEDSVSESKCLKSAGDTDIVSSDIPEISSDEHDSEVDQCSKFVSDDDIPDITDTLKTTETPFLVTIKRSDILSTCDIPQTYNDGDDSAVNEDSKSAVLSTVSSISVFSETHNDGVYEDIDSTKKTCSVPEPSITINKSIFTASQLQSLGIYKKSSFIRTDLLTDSQNKIPVYRPELDIEECERILNTPVFTWVKRKRFIGQYKEEEINTPEMQELFEIAKKEVEEQQKVMSVLRKSQYRMKKRIKVLTERLRKLDKGIHDTNNTAIRITDTYSIIGDENGSIAFEDENSSFSSSSRNSAEQNVKTAIHEILQIL